MRSSQAEKHKSNWEDLAELDPMWAVISHPERQFGKWDREEFLGTGREDVEKLMHSIRALGYPEARGSILDFGCGVGRLADAFLSHFDRYYGVDISELMLRQAKLFSSKPHAQFLMSDGDSLRTFSDGCFDLVYSSWVLQHLPDRATAIQMVQEFLRVLDRRGLLVFQLPSFIPLLHRLQLRRRLYELLKTAGVSAKVLYRTAGLHPSRMNFVSEEEVGSVVAKTGGKIIRIDRDVICGHTHSATYYVIRA
jgi:ubiquinone/menaquinone biosynthesis C-methylase UbiE